MAYVLIVDDDESDRLLMGSFLDPEEHDLYFASNGEEALKLYLRHPIEVVVTDIQMAARRRDRAHHRPEGPRSDASIVAVSGKEPHKLQVAQLAGARTILRKPLNRDDFTEAVEKACGPPEDDPLAL